MGCPGFNLPAGKYCPAMPIAMQTARDTGRQSICQRCYAQQGRYRFGNVKRSLQGRADWWDSNDTTGRVQGLAAQLSRKKKVPYFRCYDSGDLDSVEASLVWDELSWQFPDTLFWLPTKTWVLTDWLPFLRALNTRPNVIVRPSACCFDDPPPEVPGLAAGHAAASKEPKKTDFNCPGKCGTCRVCWTEPELSINFKDK